MKTLLVFMAFNFSAFAFADLRPLHPEYPTPEPGISTTTFTGAAAQSKYAAIIGEELCDFRGIVKIECSPDQLEQTVCRQSGQPSVFECTFRSSHTGKPLCSKV